MKSAVARQETLTRPSEKRTARDRAGIVALVRPGSAAESLGLRPGDRIVAINGHILRDVVDYQFYETDENLDIRVERDGRRFTVYATGDEALGVEFEEPCFDGIRRCANRCLFCFVDQLPPTMRQSLYVKGDDYRYSALYGNFVTLTNLKDADWERLAEQRLGPLHVSVHCTDTDVRRLLLGNHKAPDVLLQLRRLADAGIRVHAQVVLCPDINDGDVLSRTVRDLADLYPKVQSIGVVPVALGQGRKSLMAQLKPFDSGKAKRVVDQVKALQAEHRKQLGVGLVYLADELYLMADSPIPSARSYDGFPQYENGIGMVRSLKDDWGRLCIRMQRARPSKITAVCGKLIAPVLHDILRELSELTGWTVELVPVENKLFGSNINVSGLLSGRDVLDALKGRDLGDCVVLPRSMLDSDGARSLDDVTPEEFVQWLGVPVWFANNVSEMVRICASASIAGIPLI